MSLRQRAGDDVWIGPTATTCLEDLTVHAVRLEQAADDLRAEARSLEARAATVQAAAERAATT